MSGKNGAADMGAVVRAIEEMSSQLGDRLDTLTGQIDEMADDIKGMRAADTKMAEEIKGLRGDVQGLSKRIDVAFRRDQAFESRISKLETAVAKLTRKRGG